MVQLSRQFAVLCVRPRRSDSQGARRAVSVRFDGGRADALLRRGCGGAPLFFCAAALIVGAAKGRRARSGGAGGHTGRGRLRAPPRAAARGPWLVAHGGARGGPGVEAGGNEGGLRARRPRSRTVGGARGRVRAGAATWGGAPWLPAGSPGGAPGAARPMERAARRTATRHECSAVGDPRAGAYEHQGRLARCVAGCPQLQ